MKRLKGVFAIVFAAGLLPLLVMSRPSQARRCCGSDMMPQTWSICTRISLRRRRIEQRFNCSSAVLSVTSPATFLNSCQTWRKAGRLPRTVALGRFSSARASWSIRGGTIQGTS